MEGAARRFGADCVVTSAAQIGRAVERLTEGAGVAVLAAPLAAWSRKLDYSALTEGGCLLDTALEAAPWRLPAGRSVGAVLSMMGSAAAPQHVNALQMCLADEPRDDNGRGQDLPELLRFQLSRHRWYPSVPPGEIRLRFFLSASRELDQLACTLDGVAARVLKGRMGKHTAGSA